MAVGRVAAHFAAHQQTVGASLEELGGIAEVVGDIMVDALVRGGTLLAFGNGGSATQASHLVGEVIGRFARTRRPLAAIALPADAGAVTCIANDFGYGALFERQLEALAGPGDIAVGLTTSGKSENVLRGLSAAKRRGAATVALTGAAGLAGGAADHVLRVPSRVTATVQEVHLMLIHAWCAMIDAAVD